MATIKLVKAQIREPQNPGSKVKSYVDAFGSVNGGSLQGIKIFDAEQVADFRRAMDAHGEISKAKPFEMQANVQFKDGQAIVQSGSGQKADLQGVELTAARVFDTKSEDAKGKHIVDARGTYNGKSIRVKAFGQQAEDLIEAGIRDVSEAAPVTLASARGFFKDEEFKGSDGEMKKARHLHLQEVEIQTPALAPTPF